MLCESNVRQEAVDGPYGKLKEELRDGCSVSSPECRHSMEIPTLTMERNDSENVSQKRNP